MNAAVETIGGLCNRLTSYLEDDEIRRVRRAYLYSEQAHDGQNVGPAIHTLFIHFKLLKSSQICEWIIKVLWQRCYMTLLRTRGLRKVH